MKRLATGTAICAVLCLVAFAAGAEWGHRMGYDRGWRDCKYDAKETMLAFHPDSGKPLETFWFWHGHTPWAIRKRPSFFFD